MEDIYLGRIVAVGRHRDGRVAAMYRVSSRSFPNRRAQVSKHGASIVPKEGHEGDVFKNPYIAYNCARIVGETAVVTNGAQTDPVAEKVASGVPLRDALALSLLVMDYEKDDYDTPRIAAAVTIGEPTGFLAVVRRDGINVHELTIPPGECFYCSTYEKNDILPDQRGVFNADSADACCDLVLGGDVFASFTNPVTAVCCFEKKQGFEIAAKDNA